MLKNYLNIALRVFRKHKLYTLINIGGLTIGLATALLIFLWVRHEFSVDAFHEDGSNLYSVIQESANNQGQVTYGDNTPGPMGPALVEEIPEIEDFCRISYPETLPLRYSDQHKGMERGIWADESFFGLLTFPLLQGSKETVLDDPNQIVITKSLADRYFEGQDPIGKVIAITYGNNDLELKVSGVMQEIPANSSLQFDYVIPFSKFLLINEWAEDWNSSSFRCIVQLNPEVDLARVNEKIEPFLTQHFKNAESKTFLQAFPDRYLYGNLKAGRVPAGRITYVRLFIFIGVFILLIACINFMNLATARAGIRTKEVGVRKLIGADRKSLIAQFMSEALLITAFSGGCAILLAQLLLPAFNQLTSKALFIPFGDIKFIGAFLIVVVLTGFLSGSYPAIFLSAFKPVRILKGKLTKSFGEAMFRKVLVVFQFTLSVALVIATLVIYYQIHFIKNKNLGMDRENVIFLSANAEISGSQEAFVSELKNLPGISEVSYTSGRPSQVHNNTSDPDWEGKKDGENLGFEFLFTGYDFVKTMGMNMVAGRDFSLEFSTDTVNYLLNQTAVEMMNLEDPIGKQFETFGRKGQIVGIVEDFHYRSLHDKIDPFIIILWPEIARNVIAKPLPGQTTEALSSLREVYQKFAPHYPFDYSFLDEDFERDYRSEMLIGQLANYFTVVVIFISCLGLFGLVSFTAERRTREIGIRKVLGASVSSLVSLISRDFIPLVLIALVLAAPIAWFLMDLWLQEFYYKITLKPWIFAIAGLAMVAIALTTVSFQAIKAGMANPVKALRNE